MFFVLFLLLLFLFIFYFILFFFIEGIFRIIITITIFISFYLCLLFQRPVNTCKRVFFQGAPSYLVADETVAT